MMPPEGVVMVKALVMTVITLILLPFAIALGLNL